MEARVSPGMMLTLTYDNYVYDDKGNVIGENCRNDLSVNKADVQKFVKRLRYYYPNNGIKYLITAEYGKRTHRPHYHALIFGVVFDDLVYYKKSKRGNIIYRSKTLEDIWSGGKDHKGGICTVDCVNISAKVARYCTKYCCKDSGVDDTFMLFSRGIGDSELLARFNGRNYYVDGREYPIPSRIWSKVIEARYSIPGYSKYINMPNVDNFELYPDFVKAVERWRVAYERRRAYRIIRDNDEQYQQYIKYWSYNAALVDKYKASAFDRIRALPDSKYRTYKRRALSAWCSQKSLAPFTPPRSSALGYRFRAFGYTQTMRAKVSFAVSPSRHNTANDRTNGYLLKKVLLPNGNCVKLYDASWDVDLISPFDVVKT